MDEPTQPHLSHTVITPGDGSVTIVLDGELDIATTEALDAAVAEAIGSVTTVLLVDIGGLQFADSAAISLWVNWSQRVPSFQICSPRPMIRRVIETMGLAGAFHLS